MDFAIKTSYQRQNPYILYFIGILLSSHSPPVSTPLEPCRVAPYVSLPAMRASNMSSVSSASHQYSTSAAAAAAAAAAAFSGFDPALISAAHQVIFCLFHRHMTVFLIISAFCFYGG